MELDVVVVGHATVDMNVFPHGMIESLLGGAPTYAGFSLKSLGRDVGIVSKIGKDFPDYFPPIFSRYGLNTEGILATSGETTKFENKYTESGERDQTVTGVADSIKPKDIPQVYLNASGFYVSPVLDEVSPETLSRISEGAGVVMFDPQGEFRKIDSSGKISLQKPDNLEEYLSEVDIVKIGKDEFKAFGESEDDVLRNLTEMGPDIAVLTLGSEGSKVFCDGEITKVDSIDVEAEDLTGAGDVFGAAFLSSYLDNKDPIEAAKFGNVAAGLKIEYKGPTGFPSREEVREVLKGLK